MNTLSLTWGLRPGRKDAGSFGGSQTERRYLDFVVDGHGLAYRVQAAFGDLIGVLGWQRPEDDERAVDELLLRQPGPSVLEGRVPLYVCPECGGIDCGAVTAQIDRVDNAYSWSRFMFENDYDVSMSRFDELADLGPLLFPVHQYEVLFQSFLMKPRSADDYS